MATIAEKCLKPFNWRKFIQSLKSILACSKLIVVLNDMAIAYGMLPSELLAKATTQDLMIYNNANMIKYRELNS